MTSSTELTKDNNAADKAVKTSKRTRKKQPKTFKDAYYILQKNAEALQQQDEADIDSLMTRVEESITAYKVCQQRLQAVQQALDATFAQDDN